MSRIERLNVSLKFDENEINVGELVSKGKQIFYRYTSDFLDRKIEISPFKLKLTDQIVSADPMPFEGLYGVFSDSLPDGWGKLLLDRSLSNQGLNIYDISMFDRLSYIGSKGMGALIYRPDTIFQSHEELELELDYIASEMNLLIEGTSSEIIDDLFKLGGTSGGARPKILVGYNSKTDHLIYGKENLPDDYEHWIIKFPSSYDRMDIASIEYSYYKMALDAGIEMSESKLFQGVSGQLYFGTKRFDRVKNSRLHMHSASGLMHDNFRLSNLDYGNLMDCAFKLENHFGAYMKILRLAAFNIYTHNRDDHSKNFSFLMNSKGEWKLAPAYDLTFSSSSHGMHSTMVAGESKTPGKKELQELGNHFNVKKVDEMIDSIKEVTSKWSNYASNYGVTKESTRMIEKALCQLRKN